MRDVYPADEVIREFRPEDEPVLLALFEACEDYFLAATGLLAGPGDVQSLFYALPECAVEADKQVPVVTGGEGDVCGVVDLVLRHPTHDGCAVGLFLLHPRLRRCGTGTALAAALMHEARSQGIRRISANVPENWPTGLGFLSALGLRWVTCRARRRRSRTGAPVRARPGSGGRRRHWRHDGRLRGW